MFHSFKSVAHRCHRWHQFCKILVVRILAFQCGMRRLIPFLQDGYTHWRIMPRAGQRWEQVKDVPVKSGETIRYATATLGLVFKSQAESQFVQIESHHAMRYMQPGRTGIEFQSGVWAALSEECVRVFRITVLCVWSQGNRHHIIFSPIVCSVYGLKETDIIFSFSPPFVSPSCRVQLRKSPHIASSGMMS